MWRLHCSHWRTQALKAHRLAIKVRSYEEKIEYFAGLPDLAIKITDDAAHTEASEALARANHELERDEVLLGRALDVDAKAGDTLGKLARYERNLERSLFQTLGELHQLQDRRRNRPSSPILDAVTLATEDTE